MNGREKDALKTVEKYYKDYGIRAKELAAEGKKVIGYICSMVPSGNHYRSRVYPFSGERRYP